MFQPIWATLVTAAVGAATLIVVAMFGGRREAWDSELYWVFLMPAIALTAFLVSFKVPVRAWRWAMFPFGAQALVAFVQNPTANLLPLGLIAFFIFGALCLSPARLGALAAKKLSR